MEFTRLEKYLVQQACKGPIVEKIVGVAGQVTEPENPDLDWLRQHSKPVTSTSICSLLMLAAAIETEEAFEQIRLPGTLVTLRVDRTEWVTPIAKAFEAAVRPFGKIITDVNWSHINAWTSMHTQVIFSTRGNRGAFDDGETAKKNSCEEIPEGHLIDALGAQLPTLIVYAANEDPIPPSFRPAVDIQISVPTPSAPIIEKLMHCFCEEGEGVEVREIPELLPAHIAVAFRMALPRDRALEILQSFSAGREKADVGSIAAQSTNPLPGLKPVQQWAEGLLLDMQAYRAGAIELSDLPRGIIVEGPPGVGKTYSASAVAKYIGIPIVHGSVGRWLGTGLGHLGTFCREMRADFHRAKRAAPSLLVIDEIDAIPQRTDGERFWNAAIAALLESLDGSDTRDGVVVMGLCNDASGLDHALARSGRFDQTIIVDFPTVPELAEIYLSLLDAELPDTDFMPLAVLSAGATIADADRVVKEARRAARREGRALGITDVVRVVSASGQLGSALNKERSAVHEAGHAIIAHLENFSVESITLSHSMGRGALGWMDASAGQFTGTISDVERYARVLLAGRAAETVLLGSPSIGAGDDLRRATELFTRAFAEEGLGETLIWRSVSAARPYMSWDISKGVENALKKCHAEVSTLLDNNVVTLLRIKGLLLARGHLGSEELAALLADAGLQRHGRTQ